MVYFDSIANLEYNISYTVHWSALFVKFVRNLENFFEKYIEGFFNKKFASGLQPVEIAKHLLREMESQRSIGVSHIYVPNSYLVSINSEDYTHLSPYSQAIQLELSHYLTVEAKQRGYTIVGKPIVEIALAENIIEGLFHITSRFTEPLPSLTPDEPPDSSEISETRIFAKVSIEPSVPKQSISGLLTVIEGLDSGRQVDIQKDRVNIGRRESNELALADMNTSRLHAYIVCEENVHVLHDAKSLNGTYVNEHRITRKRLTSGDKIKLGNTIILYEVK